MFLKLAQFLTYGLFGIEHGSKFGDIVEFFIYDTTKILFMVTSVMFFISFLRAYLPPAKIKQILSHPVPGVSNLLASFFGAISPFCSCSSIPLFLGFVESRVPLGVAFSFLITSPLVNEVVFIIMIGTFGLKVAVAYAVSGILLGVIAGMVLGSLGLEHLLIRKTKEISCVEDMPTTLKDKLAFAYDNTADTLKNIALYIVLGVGVGALIHGYVPQSFFEQYISADNLFAVPLAVLLGIPVYAGCSTLVPVIFAITSKGIPLGTSLAFMMAIAGLSLPEAMILKSTMKAKLLGVFYVIVAIGIIFIGYLFNTIL